MRASTERVLRFLAGLGIIIIAFYIGDLISLAIGGFISPAVTGMLVFFILLKTKLVKELWIEKVATFFLDNLILFYIPATAGVALIPFSAFKDEAAAIVVSTVASSLLVLWLVAYIVKKLDKSDESIDT